LMTGFVLLTLALGFGFFTIDNFFAQHLAHKTAFSIISWLVYGSLLIGHWKFGWRGQKAVRFTLLGFGLLALGFIGAKFVLEMILGGLLLGLAYLMVCSRTRLECEYSL